MCLPDRLFILLKKHHCACFYREEAHKYIKYLPHYGLKFDVQHACVKWASPASLFAQQECVCVEAVRGILCNTCTQHLC